MNKIMIIIFSVSLVLIFTANSTFANTKKNSMYNKSINAKCHVVLTNGREDILLYRIKASDFKTLTQRVNGTKVTTGKSDIKVSVSKVYECALGEAEFSSTRAKLLDKNLPR
jgi:hypothetical protein